jgi:hypothetical protein
VRTTGLESSAIKRRVITFKLTDVSEVRTASIRADDGGSTRRRENLKFTHFPRVKIHADTIFDAPVYILCIDKILKECERIFEDFGLIKLMMKFTTLFPTNPFQEGLISESAFKETVSELDLEIINLQTDLSTKKERTTQTFCNSVPCANCPILKRVS